MEKTAFVNLRHNLAPPEGIGHVFAPGSLFLAGSRALQAGADIEFVDLNLQKVDLSTRTRIGTGLLGSPYIPEVEKQLGRFENPDRRLILGGQVVHHLQEANRDHFIRLFGANAVHGNDDAELAAALQIDARALPDREHTSLINAYKTLPDEILKQYLRNEFSLDLGHGCGQMCSFCGSLRTRPEEGIKVEEKYRLPHIVEADLSYLTDRAITFGITGFDIYLSNLDTFQKPLELKKFAETVLALRQRNPGFAYRMRCLATTSRFVTACIDHPETVQALVDAGLHTIGFGVDGDPLDEDVKKSIHKQFNTANNCEDAIRLAWSYGITPETLMVFGHPRDTEQSMRGAVLFAERMHRQFGAKPRPHVAKVMPGSDEWVKPENAEYVESLLRNPELFHNLDFTCEPSTLTHPDKIRREMVRRYFHMMADIAGNVTAITYPIEPDDPQLTFLHRLMNLGRYDK